MSATYVRHYKPGIAHCITYVHFAFFYVVFVHEVVYSSTERVRYPALVV